MIHQVAIKSLPQEWLWCQTWCSQKEFSNAHVIDLCNDPQTKGLSTNAESTEYFWILINSKIFLKFIEPKLTAAQRIVPEWKDYDAEIKNLLNRVQDQEHDEQVIESVATEEEKAENSESASKSEDEAKHTELWSLFVLSFTF